MKGECMLEIVICFSAFGILSLILIPFMPLLTAYFFSGADTANGLA